MTALPIERFFRLSETGVRCDSDGLFVGSAPLLARSPEPSGGSAWTPRLAKELDRDLSEVYGLPIDSAAKRGGLAGVAKALASGDFALAKIGALLLRFPDPPALAKDRSESDLLDLARQLFESGLLKWGWDPALHPRTGEPPNPGWFAPKDDGAPAAAVWPETPTKDELKPRLVNDDTEPPNEGEPKRTQPKLSWRDRMAAVREKLKATARAAVATGGNAALWAASELVDAIKKDIAALELPIEAAEGEMEAVEQAREEANAALDPPKTLSELQTPPTKNARGYDDHHNVGQNPTNLAKSLREFPVLKFGRNRIDAPSNRFWIPRLKHRLITGYYNSKFPNDPKGRLRRQVISEMDFDEQYKIGLEILRKFGVLK